MKRIIMILITTVFALITLTAMAACNTDSDADAVNCDADALVSPPYCIEYDCDNQEEDCDNEYFAGCGHDIPSATATALTTEHFLQDLDYLLKLLEENYALFDVACWARSVNIRALTENARAEILSAEDIDRGIFLVLLTETSIP